MSIPEELKKAYIDLISKIPNPSPTKKLLLKGLILVYYKACYVIVSKGEFYQQVTPLDYRKKDIAYEIVGERNLKDMQYTDFQKSKFQELGFTIDKEFGNYQKVFCKPKLEVILDFIDLFNKITYEIMAFPESTLFDIEIDK
ncbi:MAG: hypothetical protein ACFFDW_14990 [Candidatus Thorarchaeota archaeon]